MNIYKKINCVHDGMREGTMTNLYLERTRDRDFLNAARIRAKGNGGNVINPMDRQPRIPFHRRPPFAPSPLCDRRYLRRSSTAA